MNVLTKGLIGLVFPVAVIGLYLLLTGNLRHLLKLRLISSTVVLLVVAAPWHILAGLRNPDQGPMRGFFWFYFVNEHFLRYLNKRVPRDYDTVPLFLFWALLLLWLIPWVAFLPQALKKRRLKSPSFLFFLWAVVILVFFSFSTRQEYYTIPALPGLALLVGAWLAQEQSPKNSAANAKPEFARRSACLWLVRCAGRWRLAGFALESAPPGTDLSELLKKNPQDYALSFGHFLDLTPQALGAFRAPLLGFVFALFIGSGLSWFFRRRGRAKAGNTALVAMMIVGCWPACIPRS